MELHRTSREYATWTLSGAPADSPVEVSLDGGKTWHLCERTDEATARILLAGPEATAGVAPAVTLQPGRYRATLRVTDDPEVVVRDTGHVTVRP